MVRRECHWSLLQCQWFSQRVSALLVHLSHIIIVTPHLLKSVGALSTRSACITPAVTSPRLRFTSNTMMLIDHLQIDGIAIASTDRPWTQKEGPSKTCGNGTPSSRCTTHQTIQSISAPEAERNTLWRGVWMVNLNTTGHGTNVHEQPDYASAAQIIRRTNAWRALLDTVRNTNDEEQHPPPWNTQDAATSCAPEPQAYTEDAWKLWQSFSSSSWTWSAWKWHR